MSFASNMGKIWVNSKDSQKRLNHTKKLATDVLKSALEKAIQKTAEIAGDFIGNKIVDKITSVSETSPRNNSVTNEEEIPREKCISPEKRQKIIDDLRLRTRLRSNLRDYSYAYIDVKGTINSPKY